MKKIKKKLKRLKYKYIYVAKTNRCGWARALKKPTKFSKAIIMNWNKEKEK